MVYLKSDLFFSCFIARIMNFEDESDSDVQYSNFPSSKAGFSFINSIPMNEEEEEEERPAPKMLKKKVNLPGFPTASKKAVEVKSKIVPRIGNLGGISGLPPKVDSSNNDHVKMLIDQQREFLQLLINNQREYMQLLVNDQRKYLEVLVNEQTKLKDAYIKNIELMRVAPSVAKEIPHLNEYVEIIDKKIETLTSQGLVLSLGDTMFSNLKDLLDSLPAEN